MVQKYQSPVRVYKYPFELVMAAYERRFPKCPQMPIVLDCEVVEDEELDGGARRETKRRCKLAVDAPYLFKKLIGLDFVFFLQHNSLDMRARTLNIEATNETFASRIEIFERCRYYAHPDNPSWTCFDQSATLDIKNFFGFEHSMEKMGMKQYTQTTLKGKEIIEYFIGQLKQEGITHVPRWASVDANDDEGVDAESVKLQTSGSVLKKEDSASLDDEYISKNLGEMTPLQESKLVELEALLKEKNEYQTPDHQMICRFLRARDFNVEKSYQMLQDSLKWRQENDIDHILQLYKAPPVVTKHFPGGWHHRDKDGRPLYVLRLGHMDVKGLLKSIGEEGLLRLTLHICEEGLQLMRDSTKELEKPVSTWCLLVDLEGLSMRHLWRPGVKALLNIIETVEKNYPETMGRVLIVRAPRVFPILWTLISTFIDENTRSKFLFYGGQNCLHPDDGLERYLPSEIIPDFLGGCSTTLIHEGGLVPKSLYRTAAESGASGEEVTPHPHQDMYKSVDLRANQFFELVIRNDDPKSVLTWDFDVLNVDVYFTVFRTMETICQTGDLYTSVFDGANLEEGKTYFKEEPTLLCRHRESVQGSHVMTTVGTYILQWTCSPSTDKVATLMFHYEILSSANYKGSMTSLQSGFSALSVASSCQSR
ncbi:protein real-time isoform X2 [Phlebotomus argentipes]|uniref:protein real-time isoform X2 n=1 Tax=Phlebotomus argentipes TaxID=94469 RepID=UPI002892B93A|nr:protein real-time isoform X2 [Phlebotomus argentipes]